MCCLDFFTRGEFDVFVREFDAFVREFDVFVHEFPLICACLKCFVQVLDTVRQPLVLIYDLGNFVPL